MSKPRLTSAAGLTASYVAFASVWIVASDLYVAVRTGEWRGFALSTSKGLLFVAVTGALLHVLATRLLRRAREQADAARAEAEHEAAEQLQRANRLYATLARASELAVRSTTRTELCDGLCAALVELAGLRLAWIGWVDEATKFIVVASRAGPGAGLTDEMFISVDPDRPESRGPTGRALIEQCARVCDDLTVDNGSGAWRERALAQGVRAIASVPLRDVDGTRGTLSLHSTTPGFFTPEVLLLVERLAADLVHNLGVLDARQKSARQAEALRESERRFRELFLANPHPMWVYDVESLAFLAVNDAAIAHYGYSEQEFLALTIRDIRPDDEARRLEAYVESPKAGTLLAGLWQHRRKNGEVFEVEIRLHELEFAGRRARLVLAHDVSARLAAERELRESELRYRSLFEENHAIMLLVDPDAGTLVDANTAATAFYGWTRDEMRGMPVTRINVLSRAELMVVLDEARSGQQRTFEFRHRMADGSVRPVEVATGPVRIGGRTLLYSVVHDISARHRAEAALRESEDLNRITFEEAPVGIAHLAPDGRWLRVNRRLSEILARKERELVGSLSQDLAVPEEADRDRRVVERLLEGLISSSTFEKNYRRPDGTTVATNVTISLVRQNGGRPHYFLAIIEDISERKAAERSLRESDARLKLALQASRQGIWDLDLTTGRAVVTEEYAAMLGYDPATFDETNDAWLARTHPEDLPEVHKVFDDYINGRREDYRQEIRQRTRDGQWKWILSIGSIVERDASGRPTRMTGTHTDITDQRRTLERMDLLYTALQAVPAGIVITDHEGKIEWVNDAFTRLTGYERGEALGGNPRLLRSGRQPTEFYRQMWETIGRGEVWSGELFNRRKDGTEYEERMIIAPVKYRGSAVTHYIAIKQDITDARRMEQQFLRSQRMEAIGLLAGGIAHDLNNVLAPIILSVELMRLAPRNPTDQRALEVIESAARRGSGVVKQVLTFARGIDGERAPIRPRDLVREITLIIEETFPRDIAIRREAAADIPMVSGDPTQLHQVLLNLAVNARDAMPDGGVLTFRTSAQEVAARGDELTGTQIKAGRYVVMAVQDTGSGMSPEVRERIFDPFYTTKPQGKGTGLGLPTVLGIVRSHGGFIEVMSEPGAGSEFRVFLPALESEPVAPNAPVEAPNLEGRGRTILVCDDEPAIREVCSLVLGNIGFKVIEATNGREAVSRWEKNAGEISAVVMDIMMPLLTGDRAAAEILKQKPDVPILFMSGLIEQDAVRTAMRNVGPRPVVLLNKPFVAADLLRQLDRALAGQPPAK
jgi:PAS domain S-box-containing protein